MTPHKHSKAAAVVLIAAAVCAAFAPALDNDFVSWDDKVYLLDNMDFRGLGLKQVRWAFTTGHTALYQPLTWLSFSLDYALWGMEPWGYHLTNILLQALAGVLFFFSALTLFETAGRTQRSALLAATAAALAFAVHPLRVESVAWAVERKDVLSGVLWLGALLAYLKNRIAISWPLFGLSLLSKASGAPFPLILILLDIYPRRRLPADPRRWLDASYRGVWLEKIPFFALSLAAAAATSWALGLADCLPRSPRGVLWSLGQSLYGLWFYVWKTLWPSGLAAYYPPRPWFGRPSVELALLGAGFLAAVYGSWRFRKKFPALWVMLAAYALLAAPTVGLVQVRVPYSACDRHSYYPAMVLSLLLGAGAAAGAARRGALFIAAVVFSVWGALCWNQTLTWRNSSTLWNRAVAVEPSLLAQMNLALTEAEQGLLDSSIQRLSLAVDGQVSSAEAWENLGVALGWAGRGPEAEAALRRALRLEPAPERRRKLGIQLSWGGQTSLKEAEGHLTEAWLRADFKARLALARVYARRGRTDQALKEYEAVVADDPDNGAALNNLGLMLDGLGRRGEARRRYQQSIRFKEARAQAHYNWANSLFSDGGFAESSRHYAEALRLDPGMAVARVNWGNALARQGNLRGAADQYRKALKSDPGLSEARVNLSAVERFLP